MLMRSFLGRCYGRGRAPGKWRPAAVGMSEALAGVGGEQGDALRIEPQRQAVARCRGPVAAGPDLDRAVAVAAPDHRVGPHRLDNVDGEAGPDTGIADAQML